MRGPSVPKCRCVKERERARKKERERRESESESAARAREKGTHDAEGSKLQVNHNKVVAEKDALHKEIANLAEERAEQDTQLRVAVAAEQRAQEHVAELQRELENRDRELENRVRAHADLARELEDRAGKEKEGESHYEEKIVRLEHDLKELQRELENKQRELESRARAHAGLEHDLKIAQGLESELMAAKSLAKEMSDAHDAMRLRFAVEMEYLQGALGQKTDELGHLHDKYASKDLQVRRVKIITKKRMRSKSHSTALQNREMQALVAETKYLHEQLVSGKSRVKISMKSREQV